MGTLDYKPFTKRRRPHFNPPDATLFVTCRLAGSIPKQTVDYYKRKKEWLDGQLKSAAQGCKTNYSPEVSDQVARIERFRHDWFIKFEDVLHKAQSGPVWMKDPEIAKAVATNLHRLDGEAFRLDAYSVMSNHLHVVFRPFLSTRVLDLQIMEPLNNDPGLARIMQSIKGRSARECNLILGRRGAFWEQESFDHVIREGKFFKTVQYVLNNPVKARLVQNWQDWPWSYCRQELKHHFT